MTIMRQKQTSNRFEWSETHNMGNSRRLGLSGLQSLLKKSS
jgi:hypothetical protein